MLDVFTNVFHNFKLNKNTSSEDLSPEQGKSISLRQIFNNSLKKNHLNTTTAAHSTTEGQLGSILSQEHNLNALATDNSAGNEELDFPEGGLRAWLCVLGSFLGLTNCFGIANSTSAIETYIAHNQLANVSASSVGWVFSIYLCLGLLFGVFTGHLFDTQGPRLPIILGTIFTFAGVFAMGSCSTIYQFILSLGIVAGFGTAVQMSALIGIISHYFYKRRGVATGLATVGGSVGGAVFPMMLRKLYSDLGFQWATRIFAFILAFLDICAVILITPRFPPKKVISRNKNQPAIQRIMSFFSKTIDFEAFKDPRFLFCTLAATFSEVFLMTAMTYYGSYALFVGNSESSAYLLITIMNATGIFARAAAGYCSDKVGKYNLMSVMIFFAASFCLIIWLPFGHHKAGLYTFSVAYGIASAAVLSLAPLCISQISRVEDFGKKYSTCYFVVAIGTLVGIPISGTFIGSNPTTQDYNNYIIFVSMVGFAGVIFWMVSRYYAVKFKLCIY